MPMSECSRAISIALSCRKAGSLEDVRPENPFASMSADATHAQKFDMYTSLDSLAHRNTSERFGFDARAVIEHPELPSARGGRENPLG